jgi:hypothetical protein
MKDKAEKDLKTILRFYLQIQSALHTLDELTDSPDFVRETKQRYNRIMKEVERDLTGTINVSDMQEKQFWIDCVKQLDDVAETINVEIKI